MLIPLESLAEALVSFCVGGLLLLRGREVDSPTSVLWGWGWIYLGGSDVLGGVLVYLIETGAAESGVRSALSMLSTISVLLAVTFLYMGLHTLRTQRVFRRSELLRVVAGFFALSLVLTWATAPLSAPDRLFWRVGLFRGFLVGAAFLTLGLSSIRTIRTGPRLKYRALFGSVAGVWGLYLLGYFAATGWNLFVSPVDVSYRMALQPLEAAIHALLALGMIAWVSGEEEEKRREAERALSEAQKHEALGLLAGGVSHEVNNLSQAIQFAAESAKISAASGDRGGQSKALDIIVDCCTQIGDMTRALLEYSRSAQSDRHSTRVSADLGVAVKTNTHMLSFLMPSSIDLRVDVADAEFPVPISDADLKTVIVNLCINARDAMPRGGHLGVKVSVTDSDHRAVTLTVSDSGVGMSASVQESIFEPFFTTKDLGEGTGLGLSRTHGIVTAVGGTIEVQSESGVGTTFTVRMPLDWA